MLRGRESTLLYDKVVSYLLSKFFLDVSQFYIKGLGVVLFIIYASFNKRFTPSSYILTRAPFLATLRHNNAGDKRLIIS